MPEKEAKARIKINKLFYLILPIVIFLVSCKGSTNREWRVDNQSSTTIEVNATLVINSDIIFDSIETGKTRILTITNEDWGNSDPQQAYDVFSDFMVTNVIGDTIKNKNFLDNDNWEIFFEQTKHDPDHYEQTYTLVVKDEDFE